MYVRRVEDGNRVSFTALDEQGGLVEPVERFLCYLCEVGRSPNTVRSYAFDLRDYFAFLNHQRAAWDRPSDKLFADFRVHLSWGETQTPRTEALVAPNTLRRKFTALSSFYDFHSRRGTDLHGFTRRSRQRWVTPDLDLRLRTASRPAHSALVPLRPVRAQKPAVLTSAQVRQLLDACSRRRDRLLFAVLYDTGLRIGEALGLRHEDLDPRRQTIRVVARHNANGARAKSGERTVPASAGLFTLYADYLDFEYGDLDTDHVFVNLW